MEIVIYSDCAQLDALEDSWNELGKLGLYFVPSFSELRHRLEASACKFRLLAARDNSQITAISCFIYGSADKTYEIATRRLLRLPVTSVELFGSCVVGEPSEDVIRKFLHLIIQEGGFDLINVGCIFIDSPLYRAFRSLHDVVIWSVSRKNYLWWMIRLPDSFDEYMASLRETAKMRIARDYRRFERAAPEFRVMQHPEEVDLFLRDAETISRLTYQWNLSYGFCGNESTRQKLLRLAKNGNLRCYLTYLDGKPCAFGWGELSHRKFIFRKTGYDPQHRKLSPGSALMMRMIRDLIENTNCEIFDFLWGGDDGYKSRVATLSIRCTSVQAAPMFKPYSLLIAALDQALNLFKTLIGSVIESSPIKARLRSVLRRYGVGTF
jgi:Acetyltransferase (GNAT) domain